MPAFSTLLAAARRAGRGGFTLTELMLVVTVIAVMAGLIVPAVQRAHETALNSQCVQSLHRLRQLAGLYSASHDNFPLPFSVKTGASSSVNWQRLILQEMDPGVTLATGSSDVGDRMWGRDYLSTMWCPAYVVKYGQSVHPAGRGSYALNGFFYANSTQLPSVAALNGTKEPYLACGHPFSKWPASNGTNYMSTLKEDDNGVAYLHGGRCNMAFFDGHVESLTAAEAAKYQKRTDDISDF